MTPASVTACPSCGAAVREDATRCPLCGTDLTTETLDANESPIDTLGSLAGAPPASQRAEPTACAVCGQLNPAGARFCNACGATLGVPARRPTRPAEGRAAETGPVPATGAAPDVGRRALVLVGVGVAVVLGLYFLTSRSGAPADPTPATPSTVSGAPGTGAAGEPAAVPDGPAPPLPDSLQRAADALEAQNTASGWYEAGRYYLTAGFDAQQSGQGGDAGVLWIRRAMADFEKSLALDENADVRFALAETSQFDPSNPMRPVVELRTLLAEAPDHLGGNFLLGERRMLIGRVDSARASFERVVELAPPGDPLGDRARLRLAEINQSGAPAAPPTRGAPDGASAAPPAGTPARP